MSLAESCDDIEEVTEEVTLDEGVDIKKETSYKSKCEFCEYEVVTSKKYLAIQSMKNHKTICCAIKLKKGRKPSKCDECDKTIMESETMRRHMRYAMNFSLFPCLLRQKRRRNQ